VKSSKRPACLRSFVIVLLLVGACNSCPAQNQSKASKMSLSATACRFLPADKAKLKEIGFIETGSNEMVLSGELQTRDEAFQNISRQPNWYYAFPKCKSLSASSNSLPVLLRSFVGDNSVAHKKGNTLLFERVTMPTDLIVVDLDSIYIAMFIKR
jgi:hypothetical protein